MGELCYSTLRTRISCFSNASFIFLTSFFERYIIFLMIYRSIQFTFFEAYRLNHIQTLGTLLLLIRWQMWLFHKLHLNSCFSLVFRFEPKTHCLDQIKLILFQGVFSEAVRGFPVKKLYAVCKRPRVLKSFSFEIYDYTSIYYSGNGLVFVRLNICNGLIWVYTSPTTYVICTKGTYYDVVWLIIELRTGLGIPLSHDDGIAGPVLVIRIW